MSHIQWKEIIMPPTTSNDGLALALTQIERQFGKGSIMRLAQLSIRTLLIVLPLYRIT